MTGPDRPVRQPANTRASVLLTCFPRLAAFPCMRETRTFISARGGGDRERRTPRARPMRTIPSSTFQGRFQLPRHDPAGGSSGRSVVHTPRHRETGRPRAAQFAPRAVPVDAVKRVGEAGHGICGGDGAGAAAEGCYRASMDDGWRVCIAFGVLPRSLHSFRQALISALGSRLGDQVAVSSIRWGTQIFLYAPSAGSADEAAQVAREVLARHDVSAPVRTEFWGPRAPQGGWGRGAGGADGRGGAGEAALPLRAGGHRACHEARQERERQASVT